MQVIFSILVGYATLFLVIYLHEFGHAIFMYSFQCKKNPFLLNVKPYLFFSTPGKIDYEKLNRLDKRIQLLCFYGGILFNILFGLLALMIFFLVEGESFYLNLFIILFFTLHFGEVVSYLFFSNIILSSDMANIANIYPKLRWINFLLGCLFSAGYLLLFFKIKTPYLSWVLIFNILTIFCMVTGRIIFTILIKNKSQVKR